MLKLLFKYYMVLIFLLQGSNTFGYANNLYFVEFKENKQLKLISLEDESTLYATIHSDVNLNSNQTSDFIIYINNTCGYSDDCWTFILTHEYDNVYRSVWKDYTFGFEILDNHFTVAEDGFWKKIIRTQMPPRGNRSNEIWQSILEYRDSAYVELQDITRPGYYISSRYLERNPLPFTTYFSLNDGKAQYSIGRFESKDYDIQCNTLECYYIKKDTISTTQIKLKAPIAVQKTTQHKTYHFYLPIYQDIDMVEIVKTDVPEVFFIVNRHSDYLFHSENFILSKKINPGSATQYKSDNYGGLKNLKYNPPFVTGTAPEYGNFTFEVRDWNTPKEINKE